ncbi:unnamed protein product [Ostreobium quekettii]|uniref:BTB domain-containing protein n=1 Tax=Ostreobium quekettii TaxID=121088 RepID=A0A8S1JC65_9CHLO|nr:unnamed protein product [Ostreobium quekettii]
MKRKPSSPLPSPRLAKCKPRVPPACPDVEVADLLQSRNVKHKPVRPLSATLGEQLRIGFQSLWESKEFADCLLAVGDEEVAAHRVVLASWSPVFKALLSRWTGPAEADPVAGVRVRIELNGDDLPSNFKEVLRFMYTGACEVSSWNVVQLLRLTNFYEILPLKEICGEFLFELLSETELALLMGVAEKYDCVGLRKMLVDHLAHNFEALLDTGALWDLTVDTWEEVLSQDVLAVESERAVLAAMKLYAKTQPTEELKRQTLNRLLPCVRLPQLGLHLGIDSLISEVEGDSLIRDLPRTRDLLYNAFRHLLLNNKRSLSGTASQVALPCGLSSSVASTSSGNSSDDKRMVELMKLQARPRGRLPAFDPDRCAGFDLSCGRCTATVLSTGGISNHAVDRQPHVPPPRAPTGLLAPDVLRQWHGGANRRAADLRGQAGEGGSGDWSVVGVCPGVCPGGWYAELQVEECECGPSRNADMAVWMVRHPRLVRGETSESAELEFDGEGVVYSSVFSSGNFQLVGGMIQKIRQQPMRADRNGGPLGSVGGPLYCEGIRQGDKIGVFVHYAVGTPLRTDPLGQGLCSPEFVSVRFFKNGRRIGTKTVVTNSAADRVSTTSQHGRHRPPQPPSWVLLLSAKHAGDRASLVRKPVQGHCHLGAASPPPRAGPSQCFTDEEEAPDGLINAVGEGSPEMDAHGLDGLEHVGMGFEYFRRGRGRVRGLFGRRLPWNRDLSESEGEGAESEGPADDGIE